jgi:hypothetical protein
VLPVDAAGRFFGRICLQALRLRMDVAETSSLVPVAEDLRSSLPAAELCHHSGQHAGYGDRERPLSLTPTYWISARSRVSGHGHCLSAGRICPCGESEGGTGRPLGHRRQRSCCASTDTTADSVPLPAGWLAVGGWLIVRYRLPVSLPCTSTAQRTHKGCSPCGGHSNLLFRLRRPLQSHCRPLGGRVARCGRKLTACVPRSGRLNRFDALARRLESRSAIPLLPAGLRGRPLLLMRRCL